jgi:hypothetical protein
MTPIARVAANNRLAQMPSRSIVTVEVGRTVSVAIDENETGRRPEENACLELLLIFN